MSLCRGEKAKIITAKTKIINNNIINNNMYTSNEAK